MNRMKKIFDVMMGKDEKILVSYFPLCDPLLGEQVDWAGRYFANGTTVLEMGFPFETPYLDGKVVSTSMKRALSRHTLDDAFSVIRSLRTAYPNNILQIMTYYEIIEKIGINIFARRCFECGVDAVLSPNIPGDQLEKLDIALEKHEIFNLRFSPYNLTVETQKDLLKHAKGYIFQQAVDGVTGPQKIVSPQVGTNVKILKDIGIQTPIIGGFGISDAQQVEQMVALGTDGVVVGSAIIDAIERGQGEAFIRSLRNALK